MGKRHNVTEEVRMFENEQRTATAITHAKQWVQTTWNDIETINFHEILQ